MEQAQQENNKFKLLDGRLSDLHKGKLFAFCQDEQMVLAVEKVLNYMIYEMGVIRDTDKEVFDVNWAFIPHNVNTTDEELGRELRAKIAGLSMIDDAFKQVKKFGLKKAVATEEKNPATGGKLKL